MRLNQIEFIIPSLLATAYSLMLVGTYLQGIIPHEWAAWAVAAVMVIPMHRLASRLVAELKGGTVGAGTVMFVFMGVVSVWSEYQGAHAVAFAPAMQVADTLSVREVQAKADVQLWTSKVLEYSAWDKGDRKDWNMYNELKYAKAQLQVSRDYLATITTENRQRQDKAEEDAQQQSTGMRFGSVIALAVMVACAFGMHTPSKKEEESAVVITGPVKVEGREPMPEPEPEPEPEKPSAPEPEPEQPVAPEPEPVYIQDRPPLSVVKDDVPEEVKLERQGLSQGQIAERMGLSRPTINRRLKDYHAKNPGAGASDAPHGRDAI